MQQQEKQHPQKSKKRDEVIGTVIGLLSFRVLLHRWRRRSALPNEKIANTASATAFFFLVYTFFLYTF